MEPVISKFGFRGYRITKFEYTAEPVDVEKITYRIDMDVEVSEPQEREGQIEATVTLTVGIKGIAKRKVVRKVKATLVGFFTGQDMSEEEFLNYCHIAGPTHLLSVLRSFIISVTSMTGNETIIMPLINVIETLKRKADDRNKSGRS